MAKLPKVVRDDLLRIWHKGGVLWDRRKSPGINGGKSYVEVTLSSLRLEDPKNKMTHVEFLNRVLEVTTGDRKLSEV